MKTLASLFASFVLTAAMLTGCGCTNRNAGMTTPTTMLPTTEMTTVPTTVPTQPSTEPSGTNGTNSTDETVNHGNGPLVEESTGASESTAEATAQSRSRNMPIK